MVTSNFRPKWWQLYLTLPLLGALFFIENRLKISSRGHQAVQIGILIIIYGLIYWWLKTNRGALSNMDQPQQSARIRIIQVPWKQISDSTDAQPAALLSAPLEIKGVLSDTFEIDYIDAVALPVDEVSKESKKE